MAISKHDLTHSTVLKSKGQKCKPLQRLFCVLQYTIHNLQVLYILFTRNTFIQIAKLFAGYSNIMGHSQTIV